MNWKKFGVYSILLLLVIMPFTLSLVSAEGEDEGEDETSDNFLGTTWDYISGKITPVMSSAWDAAGKFSKGTAQFLGLLALVFIFIILLDLSLLVLPFGKTTCWVIAILFTIGALVTDVIRIIAGWGLAVGSLIAGGAGVLAIIMSAVVLFAAVIVLFFGGNKIMGWLKNMKANREALEGVYEAKGRGLKIREAREQENAGAGV
jgi:hypothetical protein